MLLNPIGPDVYFLCLRPGVGVGISKGEFWRNKTEYNLVKDSLKG